MTVYGNFSGSHMDDAADLEFGRYLIHLSDQVSQVELLLQRLAASIRLDEPRLAPLLEAARELVEELQRAAESEGIPERELAVNQLFPHKVYRRIFEEDFRSLPDQLQAALFTQHGQAVPPAPSLTPVPNYAELADVVDRLNVRLQRQADEAVAG